MVRKKIDNRIRVLIENGVKLGHRTLFLVKGEKARDQVAILHHMLSKAEVKARPSVLWCYKKELGFSSHRTKRMKQLKHMMKAGKISINEDDPFESFLSSTKIRYCYYSETHKILGNTYGMCVLQDFEALTPNLLARTIETVEGGGLVVILLNSMDLLSHRFDERFLSSLKSCQRALVIDDQLSVIFSHNSHIDPVEKKTELSLNEAELQSIKESLKETQPVGVIVNCCKTVDQAKAVLKFVEAITEKTLRTTVSLTASRGRGKSAALGLSVAAAIAFGYSNIFVTSPSPENLNTFFEFVFKGFDTLGYQEHLDYSLIQSTNSEFNKAIVRVNVFRDHRQTIQYIHPMDSNKLSHAELVVIDEAAAIPLPYVKAMLGPYLIFLASTINGYEGTGRSLSLKLLEQLRIGAAPIGANKNSVNKKENSGKATGRTLEEITLEESIRYKPGDEVESWLTKLLCLDAAVVSPIKSGCPSPDSCDLYYVNRDTLFSYHPASEEFLQRFVLLYVASHYKNTPNDLQVMSDAPDHHLFCLLGPVNPKSNKLPEILVVLHVCLEGEMSEGYVRNDLSHKKKAAGDLIPWIVKERFRDVDFPKLRGARIVRIATHSDYQGMGYGAKAVQLLKDYYEFKLVTDDDNAKIADGETVDEGEDKFDLSRHPKESKKLAPLLSKLNEKTPEHLDYVGVSFGLTEKLLKFWKRTGFVPVYLRENTNDLTGEHSCIMLQMLNIKEDNRIDWLAAYWEDFRKRFVVLLSSAFSKFTTSLALGILNNDNRKLRTTSFEKRELMMTLGFTNQDIKRLEDYSATPTDHNLIGDLVPPLAKTFFLNQMGDLLISSQTQLSILLGMGLQNKTVNELIAELEAVLGAISIPQLFAAFNKLIKKLAQYVNLVLERDAEKTLISKKEIVMNPVEQSLQDELNEAEQEMEKKQKKDLKKLKMENLEQFAIKGTEDEWSKALSGKGKKNLISVKSGEKRMYDGNDEDKQEDVKPKLKKKKHFKQKT